jgi:plasmid maintenance system antidote protein VapI
VSTGGGPLWNGPFLGWQSAITVAMAPQIETRFGNGPELWLNMQQGRDLWHGRRAIKAQLAKIERAPVAA